MEAKAGMTSLGMSFCGVLQKGQRDMAMEMLPQLNRNLQECEAAQYFATIKNVLSTAVRKRDNEIFDTIIVEQSERLLNLLRQQELQESAREFVDFLAFTVCDRRISESRLAVAPLVEAYTSGLPEDKLLLFWNEWTSLIARIARRQWQEETDWLLKLMLHQLWRRNDVKLCQKVIWQLQMHVAMHCRFDSFEGMLKLYRLLFQGYLHVVDFTGKHHISLEKRLSWLQMALRGFAEMLMQLARVQMIEEYEVYQAFYKDVEESYESESKLRKRWLYFLQLSITHWSFIHYKKSRKQLEYLNDILEPYLVDAESRQLIEKM